MKTVTYQCDLCRREFPEGTYKPEPSRRDPTAACGELRMAPMVVGPAFPEIVKEICPECDKEFQAVYERAKIDTERRLVERAHELRQGSEQKSREGAGHCNCPLCRAIRLETVDPGPVNILPWLETLSHIPPSEVRRVPKGFWMCHECGRVMLEDVAHMCDNAEPGDWAAKGEGEAVRWKYDPPCSICGKCERRGYVHICRGVRDIPIKDMPWDDNTKPDNCS